MKYALICPNESVTNGYRIAEVLPEQAWPAASPTYWLQCADDVTPDGWYFDTSANAITQIPPASTVVGLQTL